MNRNEFLKTLYAYCEGFLELRALPSKDRKFYPVTDYPSVDEFCEVHAKENVYFSVAMRDGKNGTKAGITQIACLHCDIDFKDIPETEAIKKIQEFQFKPTLIVRSGGGFHAYWRLKEAYDRHEIPVIEKANKAIAVALQGDLNACDASRILRLPGTLNVKKEYGKPRAVVCTKYEDIDYDVSDFEDLALDLQSSISTSVSFACLRDTSTSLEQQKAGQSSEQPISFLRGHRDATLFHVANYLAKGGMIQDNIVKILHFLGTHCSPPFPEQEINEKIKSALSRKTRREKTIVDEVRDWILSSKGDFMSSEVVRDLNLSSIGVNWRQTSSLSSESSVSSESSGWSRSQKKNLSKILNRFCEEGLIERVGTRRGSWRLIEEDTEEIDFRNVTAEPIYFKWPLPGLGNMIEIFPGNIVVVAGVMNSGKSAFMLDFTFKNMADHEIHYFSSEMGAIEMRKRLLMFNIDLDKWKFKAKERSSNFPDVITPDAVNIIDYLELHDNFYQISGILKAIHDRLKSGIALIALQKNPGAPTGIGGYRGLEKPRLYLNLEPDYPGARISIVKAKNWATNLNPNNYACRFKLISGCHFVEDGDWFLDLGK